VNDNLAIFLVLTISIVSAVVLVIALASIRAKAKLRGIAAAGGALVQPEVERLGIENGQLRAELGALHQRIAVLETIATDPAARTALEIEQLR